jgi:hypothetical protein
MSKSISMPSIASVVRDPLHDPGARTRRIGSQLVFAGLELAGVDDAHLEQVVARNRPVAAGGEHLALGALLESEQRRRGHRPRRRQQVHAQHLLPVDGVGDAVGELPEADLGGDDVLVLEAQQAGDAPPAQRVGRQATVRRALGDGHGRTRGVESVGHERQLLRRGTEHQALAPGHEHADGSVLGRDGAHLHVLGELRD